MAWGTVTLIPGVNAELTPTRNQAGIVRSANLRFKAGQPQKIGGWQKYINASFAGTPKDLHAWQDLNRVRRLAIATTTEVDVIASSVPQIITPQTLDSDFSPDFTTIDTTPIVEINDPNISGLTKNVAVYFRTPISVGGLVLSGLYPINTITGASSYTIIAMANATSTVANGGTLPTFETTAGSSTVAVLIDDHAQVVGNIVVFDEPTSVGGVTVQGKYTVTGINSADEFTITGNVTASSTDSVVMNGGEAGLRYYIALGPTPAGVGYGVGFYGAGGYGLGTSSAGVQFGNPLMATDWVLDNWGEILLGCPQDGGIYYWQPNTGFQNFALIAQAPLFNTGMFVSMAAQQIIAYGSSVDARLGGGIGIYQDPMLLQWCEVGNFFEWFPTAANFARDKVISTGSLIVGGAATKNRNLIWTDLGVHTMTFNGGDSVYSVNLVADNCGLIGQHAWAVFGDIAMWMGKGNFFAYAGAGVQPIPCSVWDEVFQDLDPSNQHKVVGGSNTDFTEVWWFYPTISGGTGKLDKWAKYNTVEQTWDTGPLDRCAWIDRSVLGAPIGASSSGIIYSHETGYNDDANPLQPMFETGYFQLAEGEDFVFIDQIYPDFQWQTKGGTTPGAQIQITVLCAEQSGDTPIEFGPYTVTQATQYVDCTDADGLRPRARLVALRISSADVSSFWRLGAVRFRYSPDGRR